MDICALSDIPDPGAKGPFTVEGGQIFLVRRDESVWAYANSCPHVWAPLNWEPDAFLTQDGGHILCGMHGAWFEIETGLCVLGPCKGKRLRPYPVALRNGRVIADSPPDGI